MQHATYRRNVLAFALSTALLLPLEAMAQTTPAPQQNGSQQSPQQHSPKQKTETLKKITVLGSLIPRTEVEGAKPVLSMTGVQIKQQGYTTLWEFMDSLPQVGRAETPPTWGSTSVNARMINLRNLGPSRSLLLIDGHRVVDYPQPDRGTGSFQNYGNIPTGMVDRVEVLASGASSLYGSDAISGVVDVILKKRYQGDDLQITGGGATRGARQYFDMNLTGGRSGDKWHVVYNLEHSNRSPLWAKDRPYTDSEADAGYGDWSPSARMFGYHTYDALSLYDVNGNYITPPPGSCSSFQYFQRSTYQTIATNGNQVTGPVTNHGTYCTQHDLFRNWVLTPGLRSNDGFIYGEYDITPSLQAYGSIGLWVTHGWSQTQRPFLYPMGGLPVPFYDQGSGQIVTNFLRQLTYPEMGTQGNTYDNEKYWNVRAGLKGTVFDNFDWDLNLGSQKYIVHEDYTGLDEQGMFDFFFGPQLGSTTIGGTTYPVFDIDQQRYWYPITPAEYSTFGVAGTNSSASWMDSLSLNVNNTNLFKVPWNDQSVGWAAVLQANHQGYELDPDPRGNTLNFGDPFQDLNLASGTRMHYALGTEFSVPLTSQLTWDISGRIDKYRDASIADIARTWGTSFQWRPYSGLLLRASYGTNFHAPDMQAIYLQESTSTVGIYSDPFQCIQNHQSTCDATQHSTYFTQYAGGNPNILPEQGHGWTYGFVWEIPGANGLSWSADYWHMGINNGITWIGLGTALTDEAGCRTGLQVGGAPYTAHAVGSQYCQLAIADVTRDAAGNITSVHTGPINEAYLYVSGIDSSLDYVLPTERWGDFKLEINYTDNLTYKTRTLASDPLLNTRYQNVASKVTGMLDWAKGPWNVMVSGVRFGALRSNNFGGCEVLPNGIIPSQGEPECTLYYGMIKPWITWNTSIGYRFDERLKLTLDIHNIFDRVGDIPYYAGGFEFIPTQQGDTYNGREVFLTINYKLD